MPIHIENITGTSFIYTDPNTNQVTEIPFDMGAVFPEYITERRSGTSWEDIWAAHNDRSQYDSRWTMTIEVPDQDISLGSDVEKHTQENQPEQNDNELTDFLEGFRKDEPSFNE